MFYKCAMKHFCEVKLLIQKNGNTSAPLPYFPEYHDRRPIAGTC